MQQLQQQCFTWNTAKQDARREGGASFKEAGRARGLSAQCPRLRGGQGRKPRAHAAPCARTVAHAETVHERTHETTANYAEVSKLGQFGTTNERR